MKAMWLGALSALFFAFTFIFNRSMDLSGGSWLWSASLRYFFMVPFLLLIVWLRGNLRSLFIEMRAQPKVWLLWSIVGFGLFYAPLTFAASYGPSWLIAATWQITLIAGSLIVPLFKEEIQTQNGIQLVRKRIPMRGLMMSMLIVVGVIVIQLQQGGQNGLREILLGTLPMIVAAFAYPLGNRKMMAVYNGRIDAFQRVLGMTLASLPLWMILALVGGVTVGAPHLDQIVQTLVVAVSSGVIATILFFMATDLAKGDVHQLAAVEATQSLEVVFAVFGEVWLLAGPAPTWVSWLGLILVMVGMILHSRYGHASQSRVQPPKSQTFTG